MSGSAAPIPIRAPARPCVFEVEPVPGSELDDLARALALLGVELVVVRGLPLSSFTFLRHTHPDGVRAVAVNERLTGPALRLILARCARCTRIPER